MPKQSNINVASAYYPMTSVAGDFYDFIEIDKNKIGFFIADVSGHGVPAALIASMLKVAIQSVVSFAENPGEFLSRLSDILHKQLSEQFVTASYLYLDLDNYKALYSAAGHPPLLYWNYSSGQTSFVESNGLLFSFLQQSDYPVKEIDFKPGDRFFLYTDGIIETENNEGEFFGSNKLKEIMKKNKDVSAMDLSSKIHNAVQIWQHDKSSQQDDLTWIVIDIL